MNQNAPKELILPPVPRQLPTNLVVAPNSPATQRAYQRGELIRLGPGVYMPTRVWIALKPAEIFTAVAAAKVLCCQEVVFGAETALLLAGLPVFGIPRGMAVLTTSQSRLGPEPRTVRFSAAAPDEAKAQARFVPTIVRRRVDSLDPVRTGAFLTVKPGVAVADVAARLPLLRGLTAADGLARFGHFCHADLSSAHQATELLKAETHKRKAHKVIDLARAGAATPLETGSRCVMLQHGFQEPVLQQPHFDGRGFFLGRTDKHWESRRTSGEADGRIKYVDPRYRNGRTMEQVLMDEKLRQQRIEATGVRIIRWMWEDMIHPERLVKLLLAAEIPQDPAWMVRLV
ncbi:MAG: hypothetical protein ACTII3_11495 [Galactobacter sp.]